MARPILMPQVGQDLTEGTVVSIKVKQGDRVKKGDIVAEVESEKATFEVEAFETGVVLEIRHGVGDIATVLEPLMMVGEEGEVLTAPAAAVSAETATATSADAPAPFAVRQFMATAQKNGGGSSPLARRLAAEASLDIGSIVGSGPGGAVVKKDIEARKADGAARPLALVGSTGPAAVSTASGGIRSLQSGTGDPILFIHGFGTDLSAWRPFILHLGLGNPILAIDLPAHGANAHVEAGDFEAVVATIHAAILSAGISRLHLAAHSLGAAIAASLAGGGDLDVRSLALIAPAGLGPKVNGDFVSGFLASQTEAALSAWLELLVHKPSMLPGSLLRATLAARDGSAMVASQQKLAAGIFSGNTQLFSIRDALERFEGPVRVIVGNEDRIIPAAYADAVPAHVAVNRLPHVGHLPQLEAARLVARLVAETVRSAG